MLASVEAFGQLLRSLRGNANVGIKRLAPELGVSYSYLSKLENSEVQPSEQFVRRVAAYFRYDADRLLLSAGRVPPEIVELLRNNPDEALDFLRRRFGNAGSDDRPQPGSATSARRK